jgi:hypothetical protein
MAINIPANKIEESKSWIKERVSLLWLEDYQGFIAEFINWNARSLYFFDPAGNILELIARSDLGNPSDVPFSSDQFLSISEMGLVFAESEFMEKAGKLMEQYDLRYFEKQKPSLAFQVIGDDSGLFIMVPEKRAWYPTDKPAEILPIEIIFENRGITYDLKL